MSVRTKVCTDIGTRVTQANCTSRFCMHMCAGMHVCSCTRKYVQVHVKVFVCTRKNACKCKIVPICMCTCMNAHTCICLHATTQTHMGRFPRIGILPVSCHLKKTLMGRCIQIWFARPLFKNCSEKIMPASLHQPPSRDCSALHWASCKYCTVRK